MLNQALLDGWSTVDTIPLAGSGAFWVLTLSGLTRLARNRNIDRRSRQADGYGPKRVSVVSVDTGNYLAAIAWKPDLS